MSTSDVERTFWRRFSEMRFVKEGVTFGSALAMVISFSTHESILWAILHGIFS
tara:strand:- start:777 stop:935 length:159 start_codon:yes stop_codon:yes gene_type:complete